MKFLPNKNSPKSISKNTKSSDEVKMNSQNTIDGSPANVKDSDKRTFLKILGLAGLGILASSAFPKKADALIIGNQSTSGILGLKDASNNRINPAKEDGNLASINTQAQKLNFDGSNNLYVQAATNFSSQLENSSNVVINPATEDSLVAVKTQINKLTFDGSNNLLTSTSGGASSVVGLKDTTSTQVNPSTDDSLTYLRRIVKLMESQAVVDAGQRQRITLDAVTAGVALPAVTAITNALPTGANVIGSLTNLTTLAGQNQMMYSDPARNAYANGVRQNLIWS